MTSSSGGGHYGAWRALTAAPAMVGSVLLLGVALAGLGDWQAPVLLGWLGAGLLLLTRRGERLAVRAWCGFRRPSRVEQEALRPAWRAALARCGIAPGQVELYVQLSPGPNAYAAGPRSVAVTTGVLQLFLARRITDEDMEAVLVHELGHHATRGSRFGLVTVWLAAPWRLAALLVLGVAAAFGARFQPVFLLAPIVATGVGISIAQAAAEGQWSTVAILGTLVVAGVGSPLSDAAVSRASERAADRYASAAGVGFPLARALQGMNRGRPRQVRVLRRLLARHPSTESRVDTLLAAAVAQLDAPAPFPR